MAVLAAYGSSWARDLIYAAAVATLDPLTHCTKLGIELVPPKQPKPLQILNLLCYSGNS